MTLCGNPPDYIVIYGGVTERDISSEKALIKKIKKTLDDLWVYNVRTKLWN